MVENNQSSYRYWRFFPKETYVQIAELVFFGTDNQVIKGDVPSAFEKGFDGDPLTNILVYEHDSLIIDFHKAVHISRIACVPRGDGNGIYPDNEYELFYWGKEDWVSLGRKKVNGHQIEYNHAPKGALYWLRNHTTGIEERIFTYENGSIRFW